MYWVHEGGVAQGPWVGPGQLRTPKLRPALREDQISRETWTSLWTSPRGRAGRGRAAWQLESELGLRGPRLPLLSDG